MRHTMRHPLIFYYGHTAVFFVNKLVLNKQITERINSEYESLFAIGVDEMSWDDLNDAHYDWPTVAEVKAYRDEVKAQIISLIEEASFTLPIDWHSPLWTVMMGIEHERIHLETSSVLIRQLPWMPYAIMTYFNLFLPSIRLYPITNWFPSKEAWSN